MLNVKTNKQLNQTKLELHEIENELDSRRKTLESEQQKSQFSVRTLFVYGVISFVGGLGLTIDSLLHYFGNTRDLIWTAGTVFLAVPIIYWGVDSLILALRLQTAKRIVKTLEARRTKLEELL